MAQYRYDGLGRRIEKDFNGMITRYVYDNEDILFEFDGNNVLQARYTHGPGIDEPLIMQRNSQDFYYHADGLGSITDLTNSTGTVTKAYVYDSFGNIVDEIGTLLNPYAYTAREFDVESGLNYYRRRFYDPTIGRFLQEDPILGFISLPSSQNKYPYTLNNPINFSDPTGEVPAWITIPAIVILIDVIAVNVILPITGSIREIRNQRERNRREQERRRRENEAGMCLINDLPPLDNPPGKEFFDRAMGGSPDLPSDFNDARKPFKPNPNRFPKGRLPRIFR